MPDEDFVKMAPAYAAAGVAATASSDTEEVNAGENDDALSDDDMYEIRKKYTKYAKNKRTGMKVTDGMDNAKFRSSLIYNATVAEDQEKLWNNKNIQEALRKKGKKIINALDVIEAALLPGEKEKVLTTLDELCGYNTEEDKVNTAKNL